MKPMKKHITLCAIFLCFNANIQYAVHHKRTPSPSKHRIVEIQSETLRNARAEFEQQGDRAACGLFLVFGATAVFAACPILLIQFVTSINQQPQHSQIQTPQYKKMK